MSAAATGGVFISYRRQEASGLAGRLYDRLAARLGDDQVFMDVDTIALGVDFAEVITQAVSTCQVLLAVIGPHWVSATDRDGRRRLDDPDDIVRMEIHAALERNVRVIPILIEGAVMPRRHELPEQLAGLSRRNALSLRHESFRIDADRLLAAIEPILGSASDQHGSAPQRQEASPPPSVDLQVAERRVVVGSKKGLQGHAAAVFVAAAVSKAPVKVMVAKVGGDPVDARSIISVLALDVRGGQEIVLTAEGDGAEYALDELAERVADPDGLASMVPHPIRDAAQDRGPARRDG